jgi:hypothetical protein
MSAENWLDLAAVFAASVAFGLLGWLAMVACSIRADEAKLPRLLATARMQFAAQASGPLPIEAYWWGARVIGAGFVVVSQLAVWRTLTGSGSLYPPGVVVPWAVAQWLIVLPFYGWVGWAFWRATGPNATLPLKLDPPVEPSRYRLDEGPAWNEPTGDKPSDDGSGHDGHSPDVS